MAFRMNRSIIKGTANHKASIAKAKAKATSIVSQRRTQVDAGLVAAADALGKSYKPAAIDFELDKINIDVPEKKKKEKQPKVKKSKSDYGSYEEYLAEEKELQKNIDDKDYQAYLDEESGSGTSDENLPSREQWERNLKKPSYKPLSKKDWTDLNVEAGMKRPKVKKEKKVKVKKEKGENIFEKGYQSIKDKIRITRENIEKNKKQKELDLQAKQDEKTETDRIAEEKRLATLKAQEDRFRENKLDITSEVDESERLLQSIEEKKGENVKVTSYGDYITQEDIDEMNEKAKKAAAFDPEDERVYTKEDRERLKFDERTGEMRLPEEIAADKTTYTTEPVVEETKTITPTDKPKMLDFKTKKNPFGGTITAKDQYEKALKEYYSKSPATMRDNRIYRNAVKGGIVQQNMIKSGYKPE